MNKVKLLLLSTIFSSSAMALDIRANEWRYHIDATYICIQDECINVDALSQEAIEAANQADSFGDGLTYGAVALASQILKAGPKGAPKPIRSGTGLDTLMALGGGFYNMVADALASAINSMDVVMVAGMVDGQWYGVTYETQTGVWSMVKFTNPPEITYPKPGIEPPAQ